MRKDAWTDYEKNFLDKHYVALGPGDCAYQIKRTPGAVKVQACKQGLFRPVRRTILTRATPWVIRLEEILDEGTDLMAQGYEVESMSKMVDGVEMMAYGILRNS